jgi:hypothetical protein
MFIDIATSNSRMQPSRQTERLCLEVTDREKESNFSFEILVGFCCCMCAYRSGLWSAMCGRSVALTALLENVALASTGSGYVPPARSQNLTNLTFLES